MSKVIETARYSRVVPKKWLVLNCYKLLYVVSSLVPRPYFFLVLSLFIHK